MPRPQLYRSTHYHQKEEDLSDRTSDQGSQDESHGSEDEMELDVLEDLEERIANLEIALGRLVGPKETPIDGLEVPRPSAPRLIDDAAIDLIHLRGSTVLPRL